MVDVKYVIVDGSAIVFSGAIQHKDMVGYNEKAEGAGFVRFETAKDPEYGDTIVVAKCYGRSISLNVDSREKDSMIVTQQICPNY